MSRRFLVLCVTALFLGCGGEDESPPVVVWADAELSEVMRGVEGVQVTSGPSAALLARLDAGERPDVLLVQSDTFPSWDERADGLHDSRVVANDPLVLVTRKPEPAPASVAAVGVESVLVARSGAAGLAAGRALADGAEPVPVPVRDVLQALRDGSAEVGLVPRSVLSQSAHSDAFNSTELLERGLDIQTAYGAETGRRVVEWLASAEARERFAAAGYGPPGPDARPIDCPADNSAPCTERG